MSLRDLEMVSRAALIAFVILFASTKAQAEEANGVRASLPGVNWRVH